ncbi:MAG: flagellar protein [candidate division KSB1 bacterium]|nr:flagellar protein [candidate division KSB1 bacterium]
MNRIDPTMYPHVRSVGSPTGGAERARSQAAAASGPFAEVLRKELEEVRFSAHAQQRMALRGIQLTAEDQARLREAVNRAEAKGARDSLILLRDMAFVVSVRNRTVITALDGPSLREGVFTNIDSAVIL